MASIWRYSGSRRRHRVRRRFRRLAGRVRQPLDRGYHRVRLLLLDVLAGAEHAVDCKIGQLTAQQLDFLGFDFTGVRYRAKQ